MDLGLYIVPVLGGLLCIFSLAQLGFWAAQSWQLTRQNNKQFELARDLLRQQIDAAYQQRSTPALTTSVEEDSHATLAKHPNSDPRVDSDGRWDGYRAFRVVETRPEADGCQSILLAPIDDLPIARHLPGQHLIIRFQVDGDPVVRCYTISNRPGQPHYRLTVKKALPPADHPGAPNGRASSFVHDRLRVDDIVEAKTPSGKFFLKQDDSQPVVMLAGGIGITPMISMIDDALNRGSQRLMVLLYGSRNGSEQAFKPWPDERAAEHSNLIVVHCYSTPLPNEVQGRDYQVPGHVTVDLVQQLLPDLNCEFYLCGPPAFMDSLVSGLRSQGVAESALHRESFGPASVRRDRKLPVPTLSTSCRVKFSRSGTTVGWTSAATTLLDLAEQTGIELQSGCRTGNCGTCAVSLIRGEVQYIEPPEFELELGKCLTCIAEPQPGIEEVELDA